RIIPDPFPNAQFYWLVVLDLQDLSVVANATTTVASDVPASVAAYAGKPGYFLIMLSNRTWAAFAPTGNLAAFLSQVGAGRAFRRLEQLIEQLGTGTVVKFSYCLAATTDDRDEPGMEAMDLNGMSFLTIKFTPIYDSDGNFLGYAPGQT
ncbi:MAG: hypothetical protein AAGE01_22810, partial [Pseudomonadota bacterium]